MANFLGFMDTPGNRGEHFVPKLLDNSLSFELNLSMDYRDILKEQLKRRQELNPRFSLRSFAAKLEISPSKISEVFSGKKKLSLDRLEDIAKKLNLKGSEKEIFLLSAELESKSKSKDAHEIKLKLKKLAHSLSARQTIQRNAWYFGAVKALIEADIDPLDYHKELELTPLQIENAIRFLKRIKRFHPEREDLKFEPLSLLKKINASLEVSIAIDAEFLWLAPKQIEELNLNLKTLFKKFRYDQKRSKNQNLQIVYFGIADVLKEN